METANRPVIAVENTVNAPVEKVWEFWTQPKHIMQWNNASDDWHTPRAENDIRTGGKFVSRMEAKDGSAGFDFAGTYDDVQKHRYIEYTMEDGREVKINFTPQDGSVKVVESFEAEETNSHELQKAGWQAILDNFKKYTEAN